MNAVPRREVQKTKQNKATYASIVASTIEQESQGWKTVEVKKTSQNQKPQTGFSLKDRRIVIQVVKKLQDVQDLEVRNNINKVLREKNCEHLVIAQINKSVSGKNLVITTRQDTKAQDILERRDIWEPELKKVYQIKSMKVDEKWYKVIVHRISTRAFNVERGLELLQEEIETFNLGLKLTTQPVWISSEKNRSEKLHASVIIACKSQEDATRVLTQKLYIGGSSARTVKYNDAKPTN